jgi:hypothetical protein
MSYICSTLHTYTYTHALQACALFDYWLLHVLSLFSLTALAVSGRQCSFGTVALRDTTAPITNIYAFNTQQHQLNGIGSTTANVV